MFNDVIEINMKMCSFAVTPGRLFYMKVYVNYCEYKVKYLKR